MNKKAVYEKYGIKFEGGKIEAPCFGRINPLLVDGNAKLGKGVWTFSTLPTNQIFDIVINGMSFSVKGKGKWLYFLANAVQCTPYPLPSSAIRHGRSWCEF